MKLVIEIELNNAAFEDGGTAEVERILSGIAERLPEPLERTDGAYQLHDVNGNWCGRFEIKRGNVK